MYGKPFKMMGKSPMMKKLIGKQNNLPAELKAKIEASPAKKYGADSPMKKESSYQRRIRERKEANKSSRGKITPGNAKNKIAKLGTELKDRAVNTYSMSNLTNKAPAEIHSNIDRKTNKVKNTLRTLFKPKKKK
tara:strand:+ start:125 stop:526 length:402 start_codon:yes stop_codon:yes gene_type:complete